MGLTRAGSRRAAQAVAAAALAAVALSACSSGGGPAHSTAATSTSTRTAAQVVEAAMVKAVEQRTVSVAVSVAGHASPVATGVLALDGPIRGRLTVAAAGLPAAGSSPVEVLVDGGTVYAKAPALAPLAGGKPWVSISLDQLRSIARSLPGQAGHRLALAGDLSGLTGEDLLRTVASVPGAVRVGPDTTAGVATTHYRASADLADAAALAAARGRDLPQQLRSWLAAGGRVTIDTWIDSAGLPRRITVTLSGAAAEAQIPSSVDVRFGEFGAPVGSPPPAYQVADLGPILDRYAGALGGLAAASGITG